MKWNNGIQEYQRWKGENPIQRYCIYFIYVCVCVCVCVCVNLIVIQDSLLEKEMATHSSIPAWEIPWTEESGRLLSTVSQSVGHNLPTDFHFQGITSLAPMILTATSSLKAEYCFLSFG